MKKLPLASAVAALALTVAATAVVAQPGPREGHNPAQRLSKEDRAALFDARLAAVPVGLKLTDEQKKLWGPVEKAIRENQANRVEILEEMKARAAEGKHPDYMGRLERRVDHARDTAKGLGTLSEAMKPFWASLSVDQRRLYPMLVHLGEPFQGKGPKPEHGQKPHHQPSAPPKP